MSGFQEIIIIVAIIMGIIFLPRIMRPQKPAKPVMTRIKKTGRMLSGRQRLAIFISFVWLFAGSVYFRPWQDGWPLFAICGLGPVCLYWGGFWVIKGFARDRRPD